MKYSEYINWIIQHPENFTFIYCIVEPETLNMPIYKIFYKCPCTGLARQVVSFRNKDNKLIDTTTGLEIASSKDILLDKFRELSSEVF